MDGWNRWIVRKRIQELMDGEDGWNKWIVKWIDRGIQELIDGENGIDD